MRSKLVVIILTTNLAHNVTLYRALDSQTLMRLLINVLSTSTKCKALYIPVGAVSLR
jgi:hypothetical protein